MGKSLLLEIGVEEIPARFLPGALNVIRKIAIEAFEKHHIVLLDENIHADATPRRLVLRIDNLSESQEPIITGSVGPPKNVALDADGNYTRAALGFAKKQGVSQDKLKIEKRDKGEYLVAEIEIGGGKTVDLLPEILKYTVLSLHFPKSMRWGNGTMRFVRPIRWLLAVYDGETVEFEVDGMRSGNVTYGHRFLSQGEIAIDNISDYPRLLEENFVILEKEKREHVIWAQAEGLASGVGGSPVRDDELLSIVSCLVEYPISVLGGFSEGYLELTDELLTAVMKGHQKYMSVKGEDGGLINHFIVVSNTRAENADTVRVGAERVIKARFDDARFYFDEDRKTTLEARVEELGRVTYHDGLGSLHDKKVRLREIAGALAEIICPEKKDKCLRAAELAKTDLITGVVREFPELQGVMGKYYALNDGEDEEVAEALMEQYLPAFSGDVLPGSEVGAVLSLADRIDTVAAFFSIGLRPTGSEDPFALRRHALSAIAILSEKGHDVSINDLLGPALTALTEIKGSEDAGPEILDFFQLRFEPLLSTRGYSYDIVQSVLSFSTLVSLRDLTKRLDALAAFKSHPEYDNFLTTIKRVRNIIPDKDLPDFKEALLSEDEERALYEAFGSLRRSVEPLMAVLAYTEAIEELTTITGPVNYFFDHVLVMDKDEDIKNNRLALLRDIWALVSSLADFSRLQEGA
jgi:glycyl-tRNA synthetase beta chain